MRRLSCPILALLMLSLGCGADEPTDPGCPVTANVFAACVGNPGDKVRLNVTVYGGDSPTDIVVATAVEFHDNQNVRHFCYSAAIPNSASSCTAEFVRGSQVRIQRLVGLVTEDEGAWRLSGWGGACSLNADTEPRGGLCTVTMDIDKTVTASFEKRAKLSVEMVLQDSPMSIRWSLAFSPQKAGGNPTTRGGTFDCNSPSGFPVCNVVAYYDPGTAITVTAGSGAGQPAFWEGYVSGCFGSSPVCTRTLTGDVRITGVWDLQAFAGSRKTKPDVSPAS